MTGPAGPAITVPTVEIEMPLGVWLRQQREARGWSAREQARRLIQAGREAGDTSMPGVDGVYHNLRRWERGENEPTERYKLYYCKAFGIPVNEFGARAPRADPHCQIATVTAHGLSVSLRYVSGRLVIEVSGLDTEEAESGPGLSLVTSQDPPRNYGGRA
jgi:transcriptional regulator with XRE-family HTH domain